MKRQLHFNVFVMNRGHHESAWRHPEAEKMPSTDFGVYQWIAKTAEKGLLDSIFIADALSLTPDIALQSINWCEPLTTLGALSVTTENIGLIATASTTYSEPYNLARQFSSVDRMSGGRVGWNIVTSWAASAAKNFGDGKMMGHDERYVRAEEYLQVMKALWSSWADDAIINDPKKGIYLDADKIKPINHHGEYYYVDGPLNLPRSEQGHPVLVQAGSSPAGRQFASRHAEAIFNVSPDKAPAQEFYKDLKSRIKAQGRRPEQTLILPGMSAIIGGTEKEAHDVADELGELLDLEVGLRRLSNRFGGYDFSHLPLDEPLSVDDFPDPETVETVRSRTEVMVGMVRRERLTMRQLIKKMSISRGHLSLIGTPEQIADEIEDWFTDGAADGFNFMPSLMPVMLEAFVDQVIPILQKRGLFRTEYTGNTLRDHYGLERPKSWFDQD